MAVPSPEPGSPTRVRISLLPNCVPMPSCREENSWCSYYASAHRPPLGAWFQHWLIPWAPASPTQGQAGKCLFPGKSSALPGTSAPCASCLGFHPQARVCVYGTTSPSVKGSWKSRVLEQEVSCGTPTGLDPGSLALNAGEAGKPPRDDNTK